MIKLIIIIFICLGLSVVIMDIVINYLFYNGVCIVIFIEGDSFCLI